MATVRDVLDQKGRGVHHIHPDASVLAALEMMAKHQIGALVVIDGGNLTGIITERDYARKIVLKGRTSPSTLVREIMSTAVIYTPTRSNRRGVHGNHDREGRSPSPCP